MAQLTVLMAGLLFFVESQASDVADRSTLQAFLSKYMPSVSDVPRSSMSDYDKFITQSPNRVKHGNGAQALSIKDFNPPTTADKEEKQAVQKLVTSDSSNPITVSAIGIGLLSLATMLGVRLQRKLHQATVVANSGGLGPLMAMNTASALGDNVMEMKAQDPHKVNSSRVGWGQLSSQNSHSLTFMGTYKNPSAPMGTENNPSAPMGTDMPEGVSAIKKVLVTGAGGRTGKLLFEQLKADDNYKPVGLARSSKAQKSLKAVGASDDEVCVADVADESALAAAMAGCDAVVLCTSAVPAIKKLSLVKTIVTKFLPFVKASPPAFKFPENGTPEEVDWLGARKQIDAAKSAGVKQFVFVSSMGGTDPKNFLNSIGRQKDGSGGDILLWKRKAERYLVESGIPYTIIHPGGLVDEDGAQRELVVGVNDEIMKKPEFSSGGTRSVARADVARVCKAALGNTAATNLALDLVSKKAGDGTPTKDASTVFASPGTYDFSKVEKDPPSIFS